MDKFRPECVFLSFSDDYFIPLIALYVARKFNIPIVSSIGDDYYFNTHFSLNPIYWIYKQTYKYLIRKVLSHKGSAIYISDKIRDKYNSEFSLDGDTVYLTSTINRKSFNYVNTDNPLMTYFGNIRMGRNNSLNDIGHALGKINNKYRLEVYSGEQDPHIYDVFKDNPNIIYGGTIPYSEVQKKMTNSDITVIVEGFLPKDIDCSRYSLSTKAADALASGVTILAYGSQDCGIIEYMKTTEAAFVCTRKEDLVETIKDMLTDQERQKKYYDQQIFITAEHHNLIRSCEVFENVVKRAMKK